MRSGCNGFSTARRFDRDLRYKEAMNPTEPGVSAKDFQPALAARFYQSASVFALERERVFHAQWFCVGRAEVLAARGD